MSSAAVEMSLQPNVSAAAASEVMLQQPNDDPAAQEKIYSRIHANGEVHSGTAREIGVVCTALVGVSAESLETKLEMFEVGSRIIAEEQKQQPAEVKPKRSFHKVGDSGSGKAKLSGAAKKLEADAAKRLADHVTAENEKIDASVVRASEQKYVEQQAIMMFEPKQRDPELCDSAPTEPIFKTIAPKPYELIATPVQPIKVPEIAAAKPQIEAVPIIPFVESLGPKPAEIQVFERMFHENLESAPLEREESTVSALESSERESSKDAELELPEPVPAEAWQEMAEPADLSAEIDALLRELGVPPDMAEQPEGDGSVFEASAVLSAPEGTPAYEAPAERPELPDEEVIQLFTEALLPAQSAAAEETAETPATETPEPPIIAREVAAKIGQIEPEAKSEVAQVMLDIAGKVQKIADLPPVSEQTAELREQAEQELEQLVVQLFELIGLEQADEAAIKRFAQILKQADFAKLAPAAPEQGFIDYMHERNIQGLWSVFDPLTQAWHSLYTSTHATIGSLALSAAT